MVSIFHLTVVFQTAYAYFNDTCLFNFWYDRNLCLNANKKKGLGARFSKVGAHDYYVEIVYVAVSV
jgi:hypothetical protein